MNRPKRTERFRQNKTIAMSVANPTEGSERLNVPAQELTEAFEWVRTVQDLPAHLLVAIYSTIWFQKVGAFRRLEDQSLAEERYHKELDTHRVILDQLIAEGEEINLRAKKMKISKLPSGSTLEDLESTLESLHLTSRRQYGPKNSSTTNAAIMKIMDAA